MLWAVFSKRGRRFPARNGRETPPGSQFLIFRRCFQSAGAASRRKMGAKHRLDLSFCFSGGVFKARAPLLCAKWAQNTAWISVFDFQAVFSKRGRRFSALNGRKIPPGSQVLIFRRCFQNAGAASRRKMGAKHRLDLSF